MNATIGIITIGQESGFYNGRYFREILTATSHAAVAHGVNLKIVGLSHAQAAAPETAEPLLAAQGVSALLVVAPSDTILPVLEQIFDHMPGIIISPPSLELPLSYVASDNYGAISVAIDHLVRVGKRRILHITPEPLTGDYWERSRGYLAATARHGLEPLHKAVNVALPDTVAHHLLPTLAADALIMPSDNDALAVIGRLLRRGIRVPQDVAVVGFDDEDFAAELFPSLTTFAQPLTEISQLAATYLIDRMRGVERGIFRQVLPNRLIVRESTG